MGYGTGGTGAKVLLVLLGGCCSNHSTSHSSVRSAMRRARFELGVVVVLWVRSAGGMAMSGWRAWVAWMYSLMVSAWKPVEVKTEMELLVLPMGAGTAGRRRALRTVVSDGGIAVKLCSRVACFDVVGAA